MDLKKPLLNSVETNVSGSGISKDLKYSNGKPITSQPVCVTGASGFVAAHITKQLLEAGYSVRGTVRSTKEAKTKYKALYDLENGDKLELVEGDLTTPGSFDKAIHGCEYVMHVASPYMLTVKDPQKDLVDPAVNGTITVMQSCVKAGGVKRVILTSSMAAVTDSPEKDKVYTEADWNMSSTLERNPYYYSKRLAEEAGWKFVKENKTSFDLVVVNPFLVIGPEVMVPAKHDGLNTSNQVFNDLMNGKYPAVVSLSWCLVDVRDVARAHVVCMVEGKAEGRHVCCNQTLWMKDVVAKLKTRYEHFALPTTNLACGVGDVIVKLGSYFEKPGTGQYLRTNLDKFAQCDNSKLKKYGFDYRDVWTTIYDTVDFLVQHHLALPKKK
jgi:dihydroflavonol-4-reductase